MGTEAVYKEATQFTGTQDGLSSYKVVSYLGDMLPNEYHGLVYSKWLQSLRYGNDFFKLIDSDAYYRSYRLYIDRILRQPGTVVYLAVLTDAPDVCFGFAVVRGPILDYVWVHKDHRRLGVASNLVPKSVDTFTHVTKVGLSIWGSKFKEWKFNPFV